MLTIKKISVIIFIISLFSFSFSQSEFSFPEYNEKKVPVKEAMFWEKIPSGVIKCLLCPWECTIKDGERGTCGVRKNKNGILIALSYSRPCTIHIDPIEKKPFFHFFPSYECLSLATAGCNLGCLYCQNWEISKKWPEELTALYIPPEGIVKLAEKEKTKIIAFTYSEPVVFYEYMIDIAKLARKKNLKTVVITAGFINKEPLIELCKYVDAIKVDLKAFNDKFYRDVVSGKLEPVLQTIKTIYNSNVHLEIVYLVIPGMNDDLTQIRQMCSWIKENTSADIPLHFSRFYPQYKMKNYPPTPIKTLNNLRNTALKSGMRYVYIGNIAPGDPAESTFCPKCKKILIERAGYHVEENNIIDSRCKYCNFKIYGIFSDRSKSK